MVECHKRSKKGERMQIDYIIAEHWQKELQKHFSPEASQAIVNLECKAIDEEHFKKIFEEKQVYLIATIISKMYSIFATKEDLDNAIQILRLELKQEIADVTQDITKLEGKFEILRREVRYYAIGIIVLMFLLQPKVFDFITNIFK